MDLCFPPLLPPAYGEVTDLTVTTQPVSNETMIVRVAWKPPLLSQPKFPLPSTYYLSLVEVDGEGGRVGTANCSDGQSCFKAINTVCEGV